MSIMQPNTVYKTYAAAQQESGGNTEPGSIEFGPDACNVYWSADEAQPADKSTMVPDPGNPLATGVYTVTQASRWVLVEPVSGTPVIREFRAAVVPNP